MNGRILWIGTGVPFTALSDFGGFLRFIRFVSARQERICFQILALAYGSEVMTWQGLATNTGTGMVNRENERVG